MKQSVPRPHRQNSTNGNRRSNNMNNTPRTNTFSRQNNSNTSSNGQGESEKAINDKLIHLVAKSIGKKCIATVSSGARYQGLLLSGDLSSTEQPTSQSPSSLSVIIQNPRLYSKPLIDEKSNIVPDSLPEKLIIQAKDLMDLEVQDVNVNETNAVAATHVPAAVDSKFKTDTDISGKLKIKERELQRWVPDDDSTMLSLEDDSGGKWDQFKVNEEKFGVESTYDEHLYTTRINTSAPDYAERLRHADKIAREIEGSASSDRHVLEERGIEVDDSGLDEEDKYSGVDRRGDELMAALRGVNIGAAPASAAPNVVAAESTSPGKYVIPRQRAAQYHNDPAIISSSATKAAQSNNTTNEASSNDFKTKPDSIPAKPQIPNESFRLNAQSEINSLREFSANFKIPHKLPQDLLPILSKDKIKQDEILKKQKELLQKKEQERKLREEENADGTSLASSASATTGGKTVTPASSTPASTSTPTESLTGTRKIKMDPTKPAFKLNPNAASFTPSTKSAQLTPTPPTPNFNKSTTNNHSPRANQQRPYSNSNMNNNSGPQSSGSSNNKRHQVTAADFFGGSDKIPTKAGQEKKVKDFKLSFNMFFTVKNKHEDKLTPVEFEKIFITPPTWDSNVDESHDKLFPSPNNIKPPTPIIPNNSTMPFIPNQMIGAGGVPGGAAGGAGGMIGGSYPGTPNVGKFAISPQQHQQQLAAAAMAAHFQQQQFQAAMMYQQQQQHQQHQPIQHHHQQFPAGIPQVQPPIPMYGPGGEPFLPPGGYLGPPQGFMGAGGSPVNGHMAMGMNHYNSPNMSNSSNKQSGGRKFSHNNQTPPTGPKKGRMNEQ